MKAFQVSISRTVSIWSVIGGLCISLLGGCGGGSSSSSPAPAPTPSAATPAITSFTPTSGPIGTSVTITGTGFDATPANNTVQFNGTAATVASASTTSLTVTVPTGASSGTISVSTSGGSATSSTSFTVTTSAGGGATLLGGSIQGTALTLTTNVSTYVGTIPGTAWVTTGFTDGIGTAAKFDLPKGATTDGTNLYIADSNNCIIRKVVIATSAVTTLAGTGKTCGTADGTGAAARFGNVAGITTDGTNLFVADRSSHTIRKIVIATGVTTTLAGTAVIAGSANGTGTAATFNLPTGITTDGTNLYVSEQGTHTIRKIVIATGVTTTLAGQSGTWGSADGTGTAAVFNKPSDMTMVGGDIYVADSFNHAIRKVVASTGATTTVAGPVSVISLGTADGVGTAARFNNPNGITTDGTSLYVTDANNHCIRKIDLSTATVTTIAGTAGAAPASTDGTGAAAGFGNGMFGITTDGIDLYVADTGNGTIRRIQ